MRFTAFANTTLLIKPPKLKATKTPILVVFYSQNKIGIEELFDVRFVFDLDFFHFRHLAKPVFFFRQSKAYAEQIQWFTGYL